MGAAGGPAQRVVVSEVMKGRPSRRPGSGLGAGGLRLADRELGGGFRRADPPAGDPDHGLLLHNFSQSRARSLMASACQDCVRLQSNRRACGVPGTGTLRSMALDS